LRPLLSLLAIVALSCELPMAPLPPDAIPLAPPAAYRLWWQMVEACSGRSGSLDQVRWYHVPDARTISLDGKEVGGYWVSHDDVIVLAGRSVQDGALVRHEMLHALSNRGHTREYFLDRCQGVVACTGSCLTEAGGRAVPPADAPEIAPTELRLSLDVAPPRPSFSADSGAAAVYLRVSNPHPYPVWVRLTPLAPDNPAAKTFGVRFDGTERGYAFAWEPLYALGASETRTFVWDWRAEPGTYSVGGYFNVRVAEPVTFVVAP
jgi:hypothetical protein